jgi:hypothetical protein
MMMMMKQKKKKQRKGRGGRRRRRRIEGVEGGGGGGDHDDEDAVDGKYREVLSPELPVTVLSLSRCSWTYTCASPYLNLLQAVISVCLSVSNLIHSEK